LPWGGLLNAGLPSYWSTAAWSGFVKEDELQCEDKLLRNVERTMLYSIRQHETVNDDLVLGPYFRLAWKSLWL
jgi:hypothetical protein